MEDCYLLNYTIAIGAGFIIGVIVGYLTCRRRGTRREVLQPTVGPNFPALTETSLVDILKSFSQTHRSIHGERVRRELHVVITTLGFYAAAVSLKYTGKLPPDQTFKWFVWVGFFSLAVAAFIYLWESASANRINQGLAERAESAAIVLLERAGITNFERPAGHPAKLRWLWEALIILIAAVLSACLITRP